MIEGVGWEVRAKFQHFAWLMRMRALMLVAGGGGGDLLWSGVGWVRSKGELGE
jgi:hypothetical protein